MGDLQVQPLASRVGGDEYPALRITGEPPLDGEPLLTTESTKSLPFIADFLLPYRRREAETGRLRTDVDLDRAAEYLARAILSLIGAPARWDLDDPDQVQDLVRIELLGGITA